MGLRILERTAESAVVESAYEGLAAMPPYIGTEFVSLGIIVRPQSLTTRTVCQPGSLVLQLDPISTSVRSGARRYMLRDSETILLEGDVDYRASLYLIPNGCVTDAGGPAVPEVCSPISSARIYLYWGNDKASVVWPPPDQGAICPALRITAIANGVTVMSDQILVPQSGRCSFVSNYAAGTTGNFFLHFHPDVSSSIAIAPSGEWPSPYLIAGQMVQAGFRNTTAGAVGMDMDLRVVRT